MNNLHVKIGNILKATFIIRENRFIAYVKYQGKDLRCHLPNPGRMIEFLHPGSTVYIQLAQDPNRTTDASLLAIDVDGEIIQLNSNLVAKLVPKMIEADFEGLEGSSLIQSEYNLGRHRFDHLLRKGDNEVLVEVKSTTRVVDGIACFPDAVSKRAQNHLNSLIKHLNNYECVVIFMVYRKASGFKPCKDIDPKFASIFEEANDLGVQFLVYQCESQILEIEDNLILDTWVDHLIMKF